MPLSQSILKRFMESGIYGRKNSVIITIVLAVLLCLTVGCGVYQNRKTYRQIDGLMDLVLNREKIEYSDVKEGEFSALVTKVKRIQEVLGTQANRAEEAKD